MKWTATWIVVADGARAKIYVNDGPGKGIQPVQGAEYAAELAATHELGSDRPGRTAASVGAARHAIEPRIDWHRQQKQQFVKALAKVLDAAPIAPHAAGPRYPVATR